MFVLHPRLRADCVDFGRLDLSRLLLMNERRYSWCILVPERKDLTEIHQLSRGDRITLIDESCALAEAMVRLFRPDKMNVAVLGNVVPQLHVHHVARHVGDAAWPGPVWGQPLGGPREPAEIDRIRRDLVGLLPLDGA